MLAVICGGTLTPEFRVRIAAIGYSALLNSRVLDAFNKGSLIAGAGDFQTVPLVVGIATQVFDVDRSALAKGRAIAFAVAALSRRQNQLPPAAAGHRICAMPLHHGTWMVGVRRYLAKYADAVICGRRVAQNPAAESAPKRHRGAPDVLIGKAAGTRRAALTALYNRVCSEGIHRDLDLANRKAVGQHAAGERAKVRADVVPSPVGVAIVKVVKPSPPTPIQHRGPFLTNIRDLQGAGREVQARHVLRVHDSGVMRPLQPSAPAPARYRNR